MDELEARHRWAFDEYRVLANTIPASSTVGPFAVDDFVRPIGHMRSFYRDGQFGRLVFKGTEIQSPDFVEALRAIAQFRSCDPHPPHIPTSLLSLLDRFAIMEHKAPGVVLLSEALSEANAAVAFQSAYFSRYHELASVPVPLRVYRWSEATVDDYLEKVLPLVTVRAVPIIRRLVAEGLGAIAYYYPGKAPRISGLGLDAPEISRDLLGRISFPDRLERLEEKYHVHKVFDSWMRLVSRMLVLGFYPNNPYGNYLLGEAIQWQNTVLDGGFVDVDSVTPMREIESDRAFTETFMAMVVELATTFRKLFLGPVPYANLEYKDPSLTMALLVVAVWEGLKKGVENERGAGASVDARLDRLIADRDAFSFVKENLGRMHPRPDVGGPGLAHMSAFY